MLFMSRWELLALIEDYGARLVGVIFQAKWTMTPRPSFPDLFEAIINFQAIRRRKQIQTLSVVGAADFELSRFCGLTLLAEQADCLTP